MSNQKSREEQFNSAKDCALTYLSYRPRTVKEIMVKLNEKGYDSEIVKAVLELLQEYKLVDDDAFARMWIGNRTTVKPAGRRRIVNELMQKGLDKDVIDRNISGLLPEKEEQMAVELIEKKLIKAAFNYKKLQSFLLRRGFSPAIITKILNNYEQENESN